MNKKTKKIKAGAFAVAILFLAMTAATTVNASGYTYQILWTRTWTDGDTLNSAGGKVATDSNNNVIVYAKSAALGDYQYILKKYNSNGGNVWQITVDYSGLDNVTNLEHYMAGEGGSIMPLDIEYGNFTRIRQDSEGGAAPKFWIDSICVDPSNNILLMCDLLTQYDPPQHEYVVVLKYNGANGQEIWKKAYDYNDLLFPGCDMAVDSQGNCYIPCTNYMWSYVMKLTPTGDVAWFKSVKLDVFWYPLSVALNSNQDVIVSTIDCLTDPDASTLTIGLTSLNHNTGNRIVNSEIAIPNQGTWFADAALAVDTTDNSVFFGYLDYICKVNPALNQILWYRQNPACQDMKVVGEKLVACGGWIDVNGVYNYYAGVFSKTTGATLLDMALGPLLYCTDPFFQDLLNQLNGIAVDTQGNFLFCGGEGGMITIKVSVSYDNGGGSSGHLVIFGGVLRDPSDIACLPPGQIQQQGSQVGGQQQQLVR